MFLRNYKKLVSSLMALAISLSYNTNTFACSYFDDEALLEKKKECEKDSSKEWSCDRNHCITTVEAKKDREEYYECLNKSDQSDIKSCVDNYAKERSGNFPNKEPPYTLAAGANAALATLMLLSNSAKNQNGGSCMSKWILVGTGAAGALSEIYFKFFAEKKLKELREKYKKDFEFKDPYDAQVKAFIYLKEEQELIAQMAGQRKAVYMMLTAGYGSALAMTVFDMMKLKPTCGSKGEQQTTDTKVEGQPQPGNGAGGDGGGGAGGGQAFGAMMGSPAGIAIVSGIGMGLSIYLWKAAHDQQKMSEGNAKKVEELLAKFQKTLAGFCPNGRNDLAEPRCYCYNADSSQNKNRSNSETCQALWAQDDVNFFKKATDYSVASGTQVKSGCVNVNQQFDADCKCKSMTNSKGENACLKVPVVSTVEGLDSMIKPAAVASLINGVNSGTFTPANLNEGAVANLAIGANKARKKVLPALEKAVTQNNKPFKLNDAFLDNAIRSIPQSQRDAALADSAMPMISQSRAQNESMMEELKKAENLAGLDNNKSLYSDVKGDSSSSGSKKDGGYNFDFSSGSSSAVANKVEDFLDKKYDYKQSDVVEREDVSIWTVITNRYNQSGLKRLFGDDGEMKSE